jgi:hypothetical protein
MTTSELIEDLKLLPPDKKIMLPCRTLVPKKNKGKHTIGYHEFLELDGVDLFDDKVYVSFDLDLFRDTYKDNGHMVIPLKTFNAIGK